jgi:hypothetical protein
MSPESIGPQLLSWDGFRARDFVAPRNDEGVYNPSTIFAMISRWISDEPPKIV